MSLHEKLPGVLRTFRKRHPPAGARPGTLVVAAGAPPPTITVQSYDAAGLTTTQVTEVAQLPALLERPGTTWIDVQGLGDEAVLRSLGELFGIHPLALEDVVNAPQRPKIEEYPDQVLVIARMVRPAAAARVEIEQVGMVIGPRYLISFQEQHGDCLDPIRRRLHDGAGKMRTAGPAYLAYAIVDAIVDGYYPLIEQLTERLERIEDRLDEHSSPRVLQRLNAIRAQLVQARRALAPQQLALAGLLREPTGPFPADVRLYLRDTLDHCTQLVEVIDAQRDLINSLMNTYLSLVGHRSNEVMKTLTIMASIFIPLTFVAGVYGMNFESLPGVHRRWAFAALLGAMAAIAGGMVLWFRRRGWLGGDRDDD
ncbi:MAG: magnesium/cobalt transporter CorA [Myxococcales bacterium]|nr:magnesium/cobalt transporter CorA [Myxococcales bacterium]